MLFASKGPFSFTNGRLKGYARKMGLKGEVFDQCLDSGKYLKKVQGETGIGGSLGARGTPTFFINGQLLVGAQPYEMFQFVIDDELDRARSAKGRSGR